MSKLIHGDNGKEAPDTEPFQIVLTLDRETLHLDIGGNVADLDIAMNMLATAARFFDVQYRIAAGIQAQEKVNQAKKDLEFALGVMRKQ